MSTRHTRSSSTRRFTGAPLSAVAGVLLTACLLGAAPGAANAAPPAPVPSGAQHTAPATAASAVPTVSVKGALRVKGGERVTVGSKVLWEFTWHNTTSQKIHVGGVEPFDLAPGESAVEALTSTTILANALDAGVEKFDGTAYLESAGRRWTIPLRGELRFSKATPVPGTAAAPTGHPTRIIPATAKSTPVTAAKPAPDTKAKPAAIALATPAPIATATPAPAPATTAKPAPRATVKPAPRATVKPEPRATIEP